MVPDQATRVSDLFQQAAERPPAERAAFLDLACNGNEALRREVESLLRHDAASPEFLETPAALDGADDAATEPGIAPGRQFGPYTIGAPLGAGGMGEVYRARDTKLGREVAVKILPAPFTRDPERRARFAREARVLATLNHPHIGAIFGVEESGPTTALILELIEGPSLAECLASGPLPIRRAIAIARQIADALDAAHEKGIVHRDLKPANIALQGSESSARSEGRVKVLDFGLAKSVQLGLDTHASEGLPASRDMTAEGRILGTPAYMSPEQARGLFVDKRTDIWAFGCVLFQMLSGRKPFDGKTATDTFARILEHQPDWTALPADTPEEVRGLLLRCLEKDPARRLRDIGDAVAYLEERAPIVLASEPRPNVLWWKRWIPPAALVTVALVAARVFWPAPSSVPANRPILHLDIDLGLDVSLGSDVDVRPGLAAVDRVVAISPNGERLAFISAGRLVTRRLDHPSSVTLAGTDGAFFHMFSPDSQSVAFVADSRLKRVSLDTGAIAIITDDLPPIRGGSWGPDTIVLGQAFGGLLRVSANGANPETLTRLESGEFTHRWPQFLPDGKAVIFTSHRYPEWFDMARIEVLSLPEGRRKTLLNDASFGRFIGDSKGGYLTYVRAGTLFAVPFDSVRLEVRGTPVPLLENLEYDPTFGAAQVDISTTGALVYRKWCKRTLVWLDASGAVRPLSFQPGRASKPQLAPDGNRMAFVSEGALWVYDFRRGVRTQITRDVAVSGPALWTPDGQFITFSTPENIWSVRSDGGAEPRRLLPPKPSAVRVATSIHVGAHNGRLAFEEVTVGGNDMWDLWTVPIVIDDTGLHAAEPEVFLKTSHDERDLRFSPKGDWVAYSSTESAGRAEIYVRAFPNDGRRWKVTEGGGMYPVWLKSRPELFFRADRKIMVVPYSVAGGRFTTAQPRAWSLQRIDSSAIVPYSVSTDGLSVVALVADPTADEQSGHVISLWTNALEDLRQQAPGKQ